jgi:hypothetical protein
MLRGAYPVSKRQTIWGFIPMSPTTEDAIFHFPLELGAKKFGLRSRAGSPGTQKLFELDLRTKRKMIWSTQEED